MKFHVACKRDFGNDPPFARLDAEFVDPSFLEHEQRLRSNAGSHVYALAAKTPVSPSRETRDPEELVHYLSIDSVDTEDGLSFPARLRSGDLPSRATQEVLAGDILVSNVRPSRGTVTLIGQRHEGVIASSGFTRIRLARGAPLSAEFLFAFLKTQHARNQLIRRSRGSMYPAVTPPDVLDLWLPYPTPQAGEQVRAIVLRAMQLQDDFYGLHKRLSGALSDFLAPYGAPPGPTERSGVAGDWTPVRSREMFGAAGAARLDAEFFRQEYGTFDARCQELGPSFLLGEYFRLSPGRKLGKGDGDVALVKQAVLTNVGINWSAVGYAKGTPGPESARVRSRDILLACTAHEIYYVGRKVDYVREVPEQLQGNHACVADLLIIRPREEKPGHIFGSYVASFLRHDAGLYQVQRCIRGLRGGHVYREDLARHVRVPLPPQKWLEQFEELAAGMESARREAKVTMRRAFTLVEDLLRSSLTA